MHMYIYMCVCVYMHTMGHTHMCVYVYLYTYMSTHKIHELYIYIYVICIWAHTYSESNSGYKMVITPAFSALLQVDPEATRLKTTGCLNQGPP